MALIARLLARSRARSIVVIASLGATSTICFVFAWMAPSLMAAQSSGLERLPSAARLSFGSAISADGDCTAARDFIYLAGPSGAIGHPATLTGGSLPGLLGLAATSPGALAVVDALVATEAGVHSGDRVRVIFPDGELVGSAIVSPEPARLFADSTGSMQLNDRRVDVAEALARYGPPDRAVCVGAEGGSTVADLRAASRDASTSEGLTSAADAFAALTTLAWLACVLVILFATSNHRRPHMRLLEGLGTTRRSAVAVGLADVTLLALLAVAGGAAAALWVRTDLLRMWTSGGAIGPSLAGLIGVVAAADLLVGGLSWRRTS